MLIRYLSYKRLSVIREATYKMGSGTKWIPSRVYHIPTVPSFYFWSPQLFIQRSSHSGYTGPRWVSDELATLTFVVENSMSLDPM